MTTHKVITLPADIPPSKLEKELNEQARFGWELVEIIQRDGEMVIVLRRQL